MAAGARRGHVTGCGRVGPTGIAPASPGSPRHRRAIHPERQRAVRASLAQSGHGAEREAPRFLAVPRSERRKALTRQQISKLFHRYAREAGLSLGIASHDTRATFLTEALDRKCPVEAVQASVDYRPIATMKMDDQCTLHDRESACFAVGIRDDIPENPC